MKKVGTVIYNKLLLQAEEAQEQGFNKLAERVIEAIGSESDDSNNQYSYSEMREDINKDIWKLATHILSFYDINSVDISVLDKTITSFSAKLIDELERSLQVDDKVKGAREPKLPGELE